MIQKKWKTYRTLEMCGLEEIQVFVFFSIHAVRMSPTDKLYKRLNGKMGSIDSFF